MQKERTSLDKFDTREVLRFDISQSLDLIEATGSEESENKLPFSDLRFDLDSRVHDNFLFNFDSTFDVKESTLKTFNLALGLNIDSLYVFFDRRWTEGQDAFIILDNIRKSKEVWKNSGVVIEDLGNGIINCEFQSKMNTIGIL